MPRKKEGVIYTPKESFVASVNGIDETFVRGRTYVREGHEILELYGEMFEPLRAHYEVEQATAAPGELR